MAPTEPLVVPLGAMPESVETRPRRRAGPRGVLRSISRGLAVSSVWTYGGISRDSSVGPSGRSKMTYRVDSMTPNPRMAWPKSQTPHDDWARALLMSVNRYVNNSRGEFVVRRNKVFSAGHTETCQGRPRSNRGMWAVSSRSSLALLGPCVNTSRTPVRAPSLNGSITEPARDTGLQSGSHSNDVITEGLKFSGLRG